MASTIETGFQILKSHLELTDAQRSAIVSHQAELELAISEGFETHGTMLAGAYSRNTMIALQEGAVVDVFLVLRAKYGRQYRPQGLLDQLLDTLFEKYKDAQINNSSHGVVVSLSDYQFIVTPCFHKEGKGYVIPDYSNDEWIKTDPSSYADQLKAANRSNENHLIPLIKLIKCWNYVIDNMFDQYYLELLAYNIFTGVPITNDINAISYFFKEARLEVVFTIDDPAGYGLQVQGLRDAERLAEAMLCFHDTYKTTIDAENFLNDGDLDSAYNAWESIFAGYFPTPLQMLIRELEASGIEGAQALKIIMDRTS